MNRVFLTVAVCAVLFVGVVGQIPEIQRQPFLTGLTAPVHITNAADGSNRLFVVQQRGLIRVVQPGSTNATTFLDLSSLVSQFGSERGLLGLAFHPDFETNSFFFVNYTRSSDGATVIDRYKAINNNSAGDINSRLEIIVIPQDFTNHNGGHIAFGPDNNLYIGMGDGGSGNDPNNRAQSINSLLGKMLRITPNLDDPQVGISNYTIPSDNPFVGAPGADEIWALGLRNPYRWSFDRGGTNQLWAADVGQNAWEEVSIITNGGNYGWRVYEGFNCTNLDPSLCVPGNFVEPEFEYFHSSGRCSITGGYVYRGVRGTLPDGAYVYGDYCTGEYWYWDGATSHLIENTPRNISSFGEDEAGELYLVHIGGTVEKIVNTLSPAASADFEGDGRTDLTVFRPQTGTWYSLLSSGGFEIFQFGANGDIPVPEDYDADGITDNAVFRPGTGEWYVFRSSDSTVDIGVFGQTGDIPAVGDFVGDGVPDVTVFRPSEGRWYIADAFPVPGGGSGTVFVQFGSAGDIPVVGDYDGNGKDDLALFRPSTGVWYSINAIGTGFLARQWGLPTDIPAAGDFDGDGTNDLNIFRPVEGNWYTFLSATGGFTVVKWGIAGDVPVVGDYDGDGTDDRAIWRPTGGEWYVFQSSDSGFFAAPFGLATDIPVPGLDTP